MDRRRRRRVVLASAVLVAGTVAGSVPAPAGAAPPPGDFDSDGVVWVPRRGATYAIRRNTPVFPFTIPGQGATAVPIAGAFTGGGMTDVLLYNPGSGPDTLLDVEGDGGYFDLEHESETITGTYTPIVGDFDGNDLDDILWYGPGNTPDSIWRFRADGTHSVVPATIGGTSAAGHGHRRRRPRRHHLARTRRRGPQHLALRPGGVHPHHPVDHPRRLVPDDPGPLRRPAGRHPPGAPGPGQRATGPDSIWTFDDQGAPTSRRLTPEIVGTPMPLVGHLRQPDLDAILWYRPGTAPETWWTFDADGTPEQTEASPVDGTYRPVVADVNGDLLQDVVWSIDRIAIVWLMRDDGGHSTPTLRHDLTDVIPVATYADPAEPLTRPGRPLVDVGTSVYVAVLIGSPRLRPTAPAGRGTGP